MYKNDNFHLSLEEINNTISIPKRKKVFLLILWDSQVWALVTVGYMDPGNWSTSIQGGAIYGYLKYAAHL
ncbi:MULTISPECIES: hypothetical protein [Pasteurellaceae]|uniref:Uncharacterized protein n=1 Tax=Pasteurella atlantica TaxID=2827233 RepID=A0AAW8CQI9_9PAST|nr:hypothetical protein [Pasteurella atlantica]MBR0573758.1 hypothetical protein [Pasteurella atlantica]MDP8039694.1 hypothetical protein [Pasteurella atlantica]MDP8041879.1 hypothetical protein [Pasteurella atlantica]MDP8044096.1 hypothetical protein [Pasteurella atlantica]MDP8046074.1 hypothetical protein [Pasteurella atlantica]